MLSGRKISGFVAIGLGLAAIAFGVLLGIQVHATADAAQAAYQAYRTTMTQSWALGGAGSIVLVIGLLLAFLPK